MPTICQRFRSKAMKIVPIAVFSTLIAVTARAALAAWPSSGLPIATGPAQQWSPVGITAPGGDLQMFWTVSGAPYPLHAQRVTPQGTFESGWPVGGRDVISAPAFVLSAELIGDGAGGHLLTWYDYRISGGPRGIYGVRVNAEAEVIPGWNTSGTPICTTSTPQGGPLDQLLKVCGDGNGGAFVAWTDSRNTPPMSTLVYDVFAQHVLADGSLDSAWPATGLALTGGSGYKYPHAMIADEQGGFWLVTENPGATHQVAVIHHWPNGSVRGSWATPSYATRAVAVSDGAGGIFVTWGDCRDCSMTVPADGIYAIRLGPGAQPWSGWPGGGVLVAASSRDDRNPVITATGGAVVIAWLETGGGLDDEFKALRVEANGVITPGWPAGGRKFGSKDIIGNLPLITPDGVGGAMFAFRRNGPYLFGSRVTASGTLPAAFPDTGLALCTVTNNQFLSGLVSDGLNGAYVLWEDHRDGMSNTDVYVTRFTRDGIVGGPTSVEPVQLPVSPRGITLSRPAPNPTFESCTLQLTLSAAAHARVEVLDLSGRSVTTLLDAELPVGPTDLHWDGSDRDGRLTPPGVYLMRARAGELEAAQRIMRLK